MSRRRADSVRWAIATLLSAALLSGPLPLRAAEPDATAEAEPGDEGTDPALTEASTLYDEGQVLYSAADYTGAIEKFTAALAIISRPGASFGPEVRGSLLYNLATAHDRAYNTEREIKHLRKARELYARIVDEAEVQGYSPELVAQAQQARDQTDERLTAAEQESAEPEPPPPEPAAPAPVVQPAPAPVEQDDPPRPGRGLTIAGLGLTGLGVAASGLWIAGLVGAQRATDDIGGSTSIIQEDERSDAFDRGARSNTLAIAGAVTSGVLVAAGITLVVMGRLRARRGEPSTVACAPAGAGLGCEVRF